MKVRRTELYFGRAGDGGDLRVDVRGFWVIFHHQVTGVMKQRLTVNRVLHLHHFLQVTQLKAFSLRTHTHTQIQRTMFDLRLKSLILTLCLEE